MRRLRRSVLTCIAFLSVAASPAAAQRELHWAAVDVLANLDATGRLQVEEVQTFVFNGDWNGGERTFDIRPRQRFRFLGIERDDGGTWKGLAEDDDLDDVDEYSWVDGETLRWRSRLASDVPFDNARIRYRLRYELSNILLQEADGYALDHDFLFPDRSGVVEQFNLQLTLDHAWRPGADVRESYGARNVSPGDGFVLQLRLGHSGSTAPAVLDTSRPREVRVAVFTIGAASLLSILWMFIAEGRRGRFMQLPERVDEPWLRENILNHPAEVVGAAWDETIGSAEVVALIARMVSEGKLESEVGRKGKALSLRLKVDRDTLQPHERQLVDRLFFNNRTTTNTQLVKQHYRKSGFNPALEITPELQKAVDAVVPQGQRRRPFRWTTRILLPLGLFLLVADWSQGRLSTPLLFAFGLGALLLVSIALNVGTKFRQNIHWTGLHATLCVLTVAIPAGSAAAFLWWYIGVGAIAASTTLVSALALLTLAVVSGGINAMVSRQHAAGIAFRKRLAAARAFFAGELKKREPALRDEWFPWLLALGLDKQVDDWSAQQHGESRRSRSRDSSWSASSSSEHVSSSSAAWTGLAGGRSGGAGGGASWTAAATGLAAGVSPPSSSGSSSGGSSSSSSSSGGSSGGGGGGGW